MKRKEFMAVLLDVLAETKSITLDQMMEVSNGVRNRIKKKEPKKSTDKKLQEGDFVSHLNEKQFNELINISRSNSLTFSANTLKASEFISHSLFFNGVSVNHAEISRLVEEKSFDEFKQLTINTFKKKVSDDGTDEVG